MSVAQPLPALAHPDAELDALTSHKDLNSGVDEKKRGLDDADIRSEVRPVAPDQFDTRYESSRWQIWAYYAYYVGTLLRGFPDSPLFR